MDTLDKASNYAHETYDKVAKAASNTAESLGEKGEDLLAAERQMMKTSRHYVSKHPMTSVGIAAAVGFLLSRILTGR
ncbi:DUF883 family protein [Methylomonas sp. 2BW1-5-20]|uniref:DUF883 family protein n=1 Tax=Methylomonas sp. 2BW1-5-20 TaxID=3376686 RepID=UPI00404D7CA2